MVGIPEDVLTRVRGLLDGRGIGGGTISLEDLRTAIGEHEQQLPILQRMTDALTSFSATAGLAGNGGSTNGGSGGAEDESEEDGYHWPNHADADNIGLKKLPESFDLSRFQKYYSTCNLAGLAPRHVPGKIWLEVGELCF